MKKVSIYYPQLKNMGDQLNVNILATVFGYRAVRQMPPMCKVSAIGSGLGLYCLPANPLLNGMVRVAGKIFPTVYVWGTGFVRKTADTPFYRKNMIFCALRGQLSKKRVETITGKHLGDIVLCDGGILASKLLEQPPPKQYAVGVIPHFRQIDSGFVQQLANQYTNAKIVDLREDPVKVIRDIASCETVISTSLHGLIVADSFHIPNIHLNITQGMRGDGFKFEDYYSCYNMEHPFITEDVQITPEWIKQQYSIDPDKVELKKEQMIKAFPAL